MSGRLRVRSYDNGTDHVDVSMDGVLTRIPLPRWCWHVYIGDTFNLTCFQRWGDAVEHAAGLAREKAQR